MTDETSVWLQSCAVGEVKNIDILNDLPSLLRREGFLGCEEKYVGGFRFLPECSSKEVLTSVLADGKKRLLQWFNWLSPWSKVSELHRPGRLAWLNIEGLPLHTWSSRNFNSIASKWGNIVDYLTAAIRQLYICCKPEYIVPKVAKI